MRYTNTMIPFVLIIFLLNSCFDQFVGIGGQEMSSNAPDFLPLVNIVYTATYMLYIQ